MKAAETPRQKERHRQRPRVAAGELSTPELREVFRCSIYSAQERGLTTEKAGYRKRAEALVSDFLLAQPGRT